MARSAVPEGTRAGDSGAVTSERARGWFNAALDAIIVCALLGELAVMVANVVARSAFHYSFPWSQEVAELPLAILAFIGGAMAYRDDQQMAMHAVADRLPVSWRPAMAAVGDWLVFVISLATATFSVPMLISRLDESTPILQISSAWYALPMTAGFLLLAVFALGRLRGYPRRLVLSTGAAVLALAAALVFEHDVWSASLQTGGLPWLTLVVFAATLAVGLPIGFVLSIASVVYLYTASTVSPVVVPIALYNGITSFLLLALPFFILAAYIMTEGGLSQPLADFVRTLVGHLRGGLLQVIVVTMYIFSGISGSKLADVAAVGTSMKDMLQKQGYKPAESVAVLASSAIMGETIPPSLAMLVLGSITALSIGALFLAGVVPAALMAICLMVLIYLRARLSGLATSTRSSWEERGVAALRALPALLVPLLLVGGIVLGIATPTEISSIAVVYALVAAAAIYRSLSLRTLWQLLVETGVMSGMILFIVSASSAFSWSLTVAQVPARIAEWVSALGGSPWPFLVASVATLVIMGAVLEGLPALLIFGPLLLPVTEQLGINPLQFGIVLLFAIGMGIFLPPVGVGFYIACSVGGASVEETSRRMVPYLLVLLAGLALVAAVPWFSLVLPHALGLGG